MVWLAIILGLAASAPSLPPVPERSRPGPNEAWAGDLHVAQLWSDSQERFLKEWAQPTPPSLTTTSTIERNEPIFLFVIFDSCKADVNGKCNLVGSIDIIGPDGATYDRHDGVKFWDNQSAPKPGILALSPGGMGLAIENGEKLGRYTVRVAVTDTVANVTARTEGAITVVEAGPR